MVGALQIRKSRQCKSSKQANILFAMLLISVLSTGLIFHYSCSLKNTAFRVHTLKAIRAKKQALDLAQAAFVQLKSIANEDNCLMYERKGIFYFKSSQAAEQKIDYRLKKLRAGCYVEGIWTAKLPFTCCFDKQGLRRPLVDVMQSKDSPIRKGDWILAKQRWRALMRNAPLPPNIFPPLIGKAEVFEQETTQKPGKWILVHWENPYDRALQTGAFEVESFTHCQLPSECDTGIWFNATCPNNYFKMEPEVQSMQFEIKNGYNYAICLTQDTLLLKNVIGNTEEGFNLDLVAKQRPQRKVEKWRSSNNKIHASESNSENKISLKDLFPTKTWMDKLDACFFGYKRNEPYSKIGNFKTQHKDNILELRNYFWNEAVTNPTADVFYFNGSKAHIEERLRAYDVPQEQILPIAKEIVKGQPYTSAADFLKKITKSKRWLEIKNILHNFECLSHRTEKFKIKSWCGDYTCEMVVQRENIDDIQRTWKVIEMHLKGKE